MTNPSSYSRTTIFALARLGGKTCYWPDPPCPTPVMVLIKGRPVRNIEIAHIRAARPNGPRYVAGMTDAERSDWSNLILLCTPHHTIVDKIRPDDYPIEVLERWKSNREEGSADALSVLSGISEDRLQDLISSSMQEATRELKAAISQIASVDPDAAMLLYDAAKNITPDTADTLYSVARSLSRTVDPGNVEMLHDAAVILNRLDLTEDINELKQLIPQLNRVIRDLRNAQDEM
jgi:hypothetical protein